MYNTIIFDLDDTLNNDTENKREAFKEVLNKQKEIYTLENFQRFNFIDKKFWSDRANGKIPDPYVFKNIEEKATYFRSQRFLQYFSNINFEQATKLNEIYIEALKKHIVPIDGAKEVIKYLYEKGYKIVLATNGPSSVIPIKLNRLEITSFVDTYFSADENGSIKPHKEFYDKLLDKIGNPNKENLLLIGDELEKDIKGGNENKMDTCWFNPHHLILDEIYFPTYEISSLKELKQIL